MFLLTPYIYREKSICKWEEWWRINKSAAINFRRIFVPSISFKSPCYARECPCVGVSPVGRSKKCNQNEKKERTYCILTPAVRAHMYTYSCSVYIIACVHYEKFFESRLYTFCLSSMGSGCMCSARLIRIFILPLPRMNVAGLTTFSSLAMAMAGKGTKMIWVAGVGERWAVGLVGTARTFWRRRKRKAKHTVTSSHTPFLDSLRTFSVNF